MLSGKRSSWTALLAALAYSGVLAWLASAQAAEAPRDLESLRAQIAADPLALLRDLILAELAQLARFVPLGFLAALPMGSRRTWLERVAAVWLPALVLCFGLVVGVMGFSMHPAWSWPSALDLLLPAAGCLLGVWLGVAWLKGGSARVWMLPKLALLLLTLGSGAAALVLLATESEPLEFEPATVGSSERRRLYRTFKDKNPATLPEGVRAELRLSEQDLNQLISWGLALGEPGRKANLELTRDAATASVSIRLPAQRYLNVLAEADVTVEDGRVSVFPFHLSIGRLEAPTWILDRASAAVVGVLARDRRIEPLVAPIHRLRLGDHVLAVSYGHAALPPGFLAQLFQGEGSGEDEVPAIRAHVLNLIETAKGFPRNGEARFGKSLEAAFRFARERSKQGQAVRENRAAVLALGMLLGHQRVETFIGDVVEDSVLREGARGLRGSTLRGRDDWPKHAFVSASLSLLAVGDVSDAAGLLKEELDADGGSGFSFGDLLADRTGVTFAATATRDEATAREFQERLARGFRVDDFFPEARGLPEGLRDVELQARYGGVEGDGYRRLVEDIEQRIRSCPAYRP